MENTEKEELLNKLKKEDQQVLKEVSRLLTEIDKGDEHEIKSKILHLMEMSKKKKQENNLYNNNDVITVQLHNNPHHKEREIEDEFSDLDKDDDSHRESNEFLNKEKTHEEHENKDEDEDEDEDEDFEEELEKEMKHKKFEEDETEDEEDEDEEFEEENKKDEGVLSNVEKLDKMKLILNQFFSHEQKNIPDILMDISKSLRYINKNIKSLKSFLRAK